MTALADFSGAQSRPRAHRGPGSPGPGPAAVPEAVPATDQSGTVRDHAKTMRSWPLLVLAVPAAAEVWSGWVGPPRCLCPTATAWLNPRNLPLVVQGRTSTTPAASPASSPEQGSASPGGLCAAEGSEARTRRSTP